MQKIIFFIERHKYGLLSALTIHIIVFLYLQMNTYEERIIIDSWSFQGKNIEPPDNIEIAVEQIITPEEALLSPENMKDITSHVKNSNDQREQSADAMNYYSSNQDAVQNIKNFEQSVIDQLNENHDKNGSEESQNMDLVNSDEQSENPTVQGSEKGYIGETMVSYDLLNRIPLNNNDYYVRNPGYTCGNVNGRVVVQIKVDNSGDVKYAKVVPTMNVNATSCMISQAEKYAAMSRFNFDGSSPKLQVGTITYNFVYRKP